MAFTTYTQLRDFLDGYTNNLGEIQGDPATIAGEAATAGLIEKDAAFYVQIENDTGTGLLTDADALDRLSAYLRDTPDWNGGDFCDLAADVIDRTGRSTAPPDEGNSTID